MFDWEGAGETLRRISTKQVGLFLNGPDKSDVYGFGFFCDAYEGCIYLVANTELFHQNSLRHFQSVYGQTDPELFRWNTGNWKYPGGLFPSSSAEQREFDAGWESSRQTLSAIESEGAQGMLEELCSGVLTKMFADGAFSTIPGLSGLTVLGHDDRDEDILEKKKRLDGRLQRDGQKRLSTEG
ncbi:MAG TPA: hypothetical protein VHR72_07355 [Gemmataceae bacterium]|jgi:hypothetical protein|nr:hypothetical protein [Gemmataceae bacterium]